MDSMEFGMKSQHRPNVCWRCGKNLLIQGPGGSKVDGAFVLVKGKFQSWCLKCAKGFWKKQVMQSKLDKMRALLNPTPYRVANAAEIQDALKEIEDLQAMVRRLP